MRLLTCALAILCALTPLSSASSAFAQAPARASTGTAARARRTSAAPRSPRRKPPPEEEGEEAPPTESAPPVEEGGEAGAEGEGEDPARPPPKGKGVIWGEVTDTKLKEPVIEGQVTVVGTKFKR